MKSIRALVLAVVFAASLIAPAAISAQETKDPPGDAEPVPAAPAESPEAQPAKVPPAAASAPQPEPAPTVVVRATSSASQSVSIGDYFYSPGTVTVDVGDSVLWTNNGKVSEGHTVTGDDFDSGVLKTGDTYSHKFSREGSFDYICTLHPNMKGSVKVVARGSSSGGGNGSKQDRESDGSGGSGGSDTSGGKTGAGTESAAAGSSGSDSKGSLAATGLDSTLLAIVGIVLIELGLMVRLLWGPRARAVHD